MIVILESALMAVLVFLIGMMAKYCGAFARAEKGFTYLIASGFLYLFVAAVQYTLGQFVSLNTYAGIVGGLVAATASILALLTLLVGIIVIVQEMALTT